MTTLGLRLSPYLAIARPNHWFKNIFVLPGIVVALYAYPNLLDMHLIANIVVALIAMCLIASSYYVLNEILDAPHDALHPLKKHRPIPSGRVVPGIAYIEWLALGCAGLAVAAAVNWRVFAIALTLWSMGCIYNTPPVRTKDKPYLDVLSESLNNPLRLLLGWYCTGIENMPPLSLIIAYWMIGAFFMAVKRFAEYRFINDRGRAVAYRQSFSYYTEARLLVSITYYAVAFGLFFGIFLLRYRLELILAMPLISGFLAWYIHLGFLANSPAQSPEKLFGQRGFLLYSLLCATVMIGLLFISIPQLGGIFSPTMPTGIP